MERSPSLVFRLFFSILACQIALVSPSVAQAESPVIGAGPAGKYLLVAGAADEALELTAALSCAPAAASASERPAFGAGFTLFVFEPASSAAVASREVRLSSDEPVKTVTVPYARFSPGPLVATVEGFSLRGPCKVASSLRQVETSAGRTRTGLGKASQWRVNAFEVETGNLPGVSTRGERTFEDGAGVTLSGSADETLQFIFAAVCAANARAERGGTRLGLRLVAAEPTGTVSPISVEVALYEGSPAPRHRDHILLARQVSVPYGHFYSRQSGAVRFRIENVETAPGCRLLPIVAQRADTATGETRDRVTPFFPGFRPRFYLR